MITAIIIEDERNAREFLHKLILRSFSEKVVVLDTVDSVAKGVEAIKKYKTALDVVFLDIQMPEENGFELFKYFDNVSFDVIFTTAFKDYAIDAIKFSALDYLLKPINFIDLNDAIKRLECKKNIFNNSLKINTLLDNINADSLNYNKVALPTSDGFQLEKIGNILYAKAQGNYSVIRTQNGKDILLSKTLKHLEDLLPKNIFFRIHKSFLINLNYVTLYSKSENQVTISSNEQFPVSVRKNEQFINAIQNQE